MAGEGDPGRRREELERLARRLRGLLVEMSHRGGAPHLASGLSCAEILVAAYFEVLSLDPRRPDDPARDRFILSKGHAAAALYAALALRGFFPPEWLERYARAGAELPEQPAPGCAPGVELATGSLGHGLPVGLGMALAARLQGRPSRVFVLLGDGECNEGSVWEAALLAPARRLANLAAIVDWNRWQATARSEEVMALSPLRAKWEAFGWEAVEVDGHDAPAVARELSRVPRGAAPGRPLALIARTVKGRGVSFMEDDNNWHYRIPSAAELAAARAELGLA
jgi:transketolase